MLVEFTRVNIHSSDSWPSSDTVTVTDNKVFINPALVSAVVDGRHPNSSVIRMTDGRKGFIVEGTAAEVAGKLDGRAPARSRSRSQPRLVAPTPEPTLNPETEGPHHVSGEE